MPVTDSERKRFGVLGRIPPEVVNAPKHITDQWKKLLAEATKVSKRRPSHDKDLAAKAIETKYWQLIKQARGATGIVTLDL